jgi:hypothetical protein
VKRLIVAYVCGVIFAVGLGLSGMTHPLKVLAFLDVTGSWDPSLAFVMVSGIVVNFVLFRVALRRGAPLFAPTFALPTATRLDAALIGGAAVFGVGWGLGGFCPGPAIVSVVTCAPSVVAFVVAMLVGMAVFDVIKSRASSRSIASEV